MPTPLDANLLQAKLVRPHGPYAALNVVDRTGSTNVDLRIAAEAGAEDGTVLIAEQQTAGQGRRTRNWISPPGAGLYLSVLFRLDDVPTNRVPWLTLLAGVALVEVTRNVAGVDAVLKWPNDLLVGPERSKCAGVLAEIVNASTNSTVLGIGLNVTTPPDNIPPGAGGLKPTSLAEQGATNTDRTELAKALLTTLAEQTARWRATAGDPVKTGLLDNYRAYCATFDQYVRIELPGQHELIGTAIDVNSDGQLLIRAADGTIHAMHAGDVVHLRQAIR